MRGVETGLQTRPGRSANRLTGDAGIDVGAVVRHAVKIRSQVKWVPMGTGCIPALLVGKKYNDVRLFAHRSKEKDLESVFYGLVKYSINQNISYKV